jgi:hypothetical protein
MPADEVDMHPTAHYDKAAAKLVTNTFGKNITSVKRVIAVLQPL